MWRSFTYKLFLQVLNFVHLKGFFTKKLTSFIFCLADGVPVVFSVPFNLLNIMVQLALKARDVTRAHLLLAWHNSELWAFLWKEQFRSTSERKPKHKPLGTWIHHLNPSLRVIAWKSYLVWYAERLLLFNYLICASEEKMSANLHLERSRHVSVPILTNGQQTP